MKYLLLLSGAAICLSSVWAVAYVFHLFPTQPGEMHWWTLPLVATNSAALFCGVYVGVCLVEMGLRK